MVIVDQREVKAQIVLLETFSWAGIWSFQINDCLSITENNILHAFLISKKNSK